jgi:flagellar basal-body rod modification protein FlgD
MRFLPLSQGEAMAARSDRAAASTSECREFEENDMTVVSGTTPQTSSSSSSSTASATNALANQQIAGNFQSFLQLLTTQLQNQNPLSPLDTNQFTQQLVEFAGVQQQINTNDSLATLVSLQQTTQASQALEFVGKTAVVKGSTTSLTSSKAAWGLNVPTASTVTINITNSTGATVYSSSTAANAGNNQTFTWNGLGTDGTQQPDGNYTLTATAKDSAGNSVAIGTEIQGVVSSVDLTQSPPLLSIGGQTFTVNQVQSIVN